MKEKIKKQWFSICLVLVFALMMLDRSDVLAEIGIFLKNNNCPDVIIFLIFIFSGLLIESDQIRAGVKDIKSTVLALSVIIIFAPMAASLICVFPVETGVAIGFFIVSVMPTTLSSGIVMTGAAGGNMAHALFITVLSNFICIFSIPFILSILLSFLHQEKALVINQTAIIIKLLFLVLLPLIIGMTARASLFSPERIQKFRLQVLNQWMIISMVYISLAGAKHVLLGRGTDFFNILIMVGIFHLVLLGISFLLVSIFKVPKGRYESIIFMGSQKTLALSVMIQVTYFNEFGIALLVCVSHHIVHLMFDGYLSTKMRHGFLVKAH